MNQFQFKDNKVIDLERVLIPCGEICLVSISERFAREIFREFREEVTVYMIPSPAKDIKETYSFILNSILGMKNLNDLVLAITSSDGEFLGCVGFHGRGNCRTPELGIWLKMGAHGNQYGRQAVKYLLVWAKKYIDYDYAIYPVDKSNIASRRIPESLGGVAFKEAVVETMSGGILNEVVYRL